MKKLFLAITLIGLISCNSEDDFNQPINKCDCTKQEYNVTLSYYETRVVKVGEPYQTCEQSTNGTIKDYDPNVKRPGLNDPQITIKAYKVTCP